MPSEENNELHQQRRRVFNAILLALVITIYSAVLARITIEPFASVQIVEEHTDANRALRVNRIVRSTNREVNLLAQALGVPEDAAEELHASAPPKSALQPPEKGVIEKVLDEIGRWFGLS